MSASARRSSWCQSCCSRVLPWPRFSLSPQTKCLHIHAAEALQRTGWTLVEPPVPIRAGSPLGSKGGGGGSQGPWEGWLGSAPNLTALSQKAHADVGQGKTAKKSEPDLKTAVEEMGRAADGGSRATGKMVKTLMRPGVPVQLLPPQQACQLPHGLRTMPCPEHRQELLLPQL